MTKSITLFTILLLASICTMAQDIRADESFLKATNYLWYMNTNFNKLKAEQTDEMKLAILPKVENALKCMKSELMLLKGKYEMNESLSKLEQWIDVESRNVESLKGADWETEPIWQLGSTLIEMDLEDMVNNEICK
jgi:hypothetical protein